MLSYIPSWKGNIIDSGPVPQSKTVDKSTELYSMKRSTIKFIKHCIGAFAFVRTF